MHINGHRKHPCKNALMLQNALDPYCENELLGHFRTSRERSSEFRVGQMHSIKYLELMVAQSYSTLFI